MKPAAILLIHSIISSALDLAVRYDWADRNVANNASPPHPRTGPAPLTLRTDRLGAGDAGQTRARNREGAVTLALGDGEGMTGS
jgi:hypothetical protein